MTSNRLAYKELPDRFQTGFRNYVGLVGLQSSAEYLLRHGLKNIRSKVIGLANILRDELQRIPGVTLYGPAHEQRRTSIVSFGIDDLEPEYVVKRLEKRRRRLGSTRNNGSENRARLPTFVQL